MFPYRNDGSIARHAPPVVARKGQRAHGTGSPLLRQEELLAPAASPQASGDSRHATEEVGRALRDGAAARLAEIVETLLREDAAR